MDVLVAGGSGFVGQSLCRVLAERGHEVTAASRSPDGTSLSGGVETTAVDVTRPDLETVVAGHVDVSSADAVDRLRGGRGQQDRRPGMGLAPLAPRGDRRGEGG